MILQVGGRYSAPLSAGPQGLGASHGGCVPAAAQGSAAARPRTWLYWHEWKHKGGNTSAAAGSKRLRMRALLQRLCNMNWAIF